jgi:hypothetical protein
MAERRKRGKTTEEVIAERDAEKTEDGEVFSGQLRKNTPHLTQLQRTVVELYARGRSRKSVIELLGDHLGPRPGRKLRHWEETQWFRDAVYDASIVHTDLQIPTILRGVVRRAKRGRVDAAKLALEVTGRHSTRDTDATPAVVNINFGGLPRPASRPSHDIELEAEDADFELPPGDNSD